MHMRTCLAIVLTMVTLSAFGQQPPQQTRWHEYTAKFKTPKNPVDVKLASYVGGNGVVERVPDG